MELRDMLIKNILNSIIFDNIKLNTLNILWNSVSHKFLLSREINDYIYLRNLEQFK